MSGIAASAGADVTVTLPAHQAGDVFLLLGWVRDQDDTVTVAGWTQIASWTRGTTSRYWLFGRRATSTAETDPVFNKSGATGDTYAAVLSVRGADSASTPWEVVGATASGTSDPATLSGITPSTDGSLVVACLGGEDNNNNQVGWAATNPSTLTDHYVESTTGNDGMIAFGEGPQTTAAATGQVSADFTPSVPVGWGGVVVALKAPPPAPPSTPGTPSLGSVTATGLTATWSPSASGTPPITYTVQKSLAGAGSWTDLAGCVGVSASPCTGSGLSANTSHDFRVVATNSAGSATSGTATQLTLPGQPAMAGYSNVTATSVTVSWTMPGTTTGLTYTVQRAAASGGPYSNVAGCSGVAATSCTDAGPLSASTQYWYRVLATNTAGAGLPAAGTSVTTAASAQTLLATGSDPVPTQPLCPGGPAAYVDQLVFSSTPTADVVTSLEVALGAGAGAALSLVEVRDAGGSPLAPPRTQAPAGDTVTLGSVQSATGAGTTYRVYVTPRSHLLTADGSYAVTARVASFTTSQHPAQGSDSASAFTIDNAPLAQATWGAVTTGDNQVQLAWTNPAADGGAALDRLVVLRRRTTAAFTDSGLADGGAPPAAGTTTADGSYVVYSQGGAAGAPVSFTDGTVVNGNDYVYRLYALDACGNWNAGASSGPYRPLGVFRAEGSTVAGAPMISIVNPLKGSAVSGTFRVQIRVFNGTGQGGIAGLVPDSLAYSIDGGASWQTAGLTALTGFDTLTNGVLTGRTFEVQLTPATGSHTLRARVSNALASDVLSNAVPITARASGGAGTLLVRDNSSQLCSDCHAIQGHTSESTASARGSWSTTCRDCHTPHRTTNLSLVAEQITPPEISGPQAPKAVVFRNKSGSADGSYASPAANGPCQVCHTRTSYYLSDGTGASHYTSPCAGCHLHTKGLAASCTGCHGTESRASIAGADAQQPAAPPAVAADALVSSPNGGAHVAHVNQATWRGAPLQCAHCHPSPNVHQRDQGQPSQTDVVWPGLASAGGVTPTPAAGALSSSWPASAGCTNYCHGASLGRGGGSNRNPGWIGGPTHAACGTCHAVLPPVGGASAGVHPQNQACATCHGEGYGYAAGAGSVADPARSRHVDGTLDRPQGCTACHGQLTATSGEVVASGAAEAAPGFDATSVDTRGSFDRAQLGVGAHGKHVNAGMMSGKSCAVCHGSTPADGDEAHANASVGIGWTSPANAKSVSPTWSSGSCTNYCHSSGLPIGGTVALRPAISWTRTTALGCGDCHAATPPTNAHAAHVTAYGVGCRACHATTAASGLGIVAGGGAHVSGGNDVGFDPGDPYSAPGDYSTTLFTCASTYCHSDGTDRNAAGGFAANTSRAWNAGDGGCAACHPTGTALASGSHPAHVNQAGTYATTFGCQTCHLSTTGDGSTIASTTFHVNMAADVTPVATLGYASAAGSCTTYCHSSGQGGAATPQKYSDMAWGTPLADDCKQCHGRYGPADPGFTDSFGAPNYVNGGTAAATANSHKKHVSSAADCRACHEATANAAGDGIVAGTAHLDGNRQVDFDAARAGASATYSNDASKRCSNVSCHGQGQPQWGGTVTCSDCHLGGSDSPDYASITNGVASVIGSAEWTAVGHGQGAGFEEFGAVSNRCVYCHDDQNASANHKQPGNPFRLRGAADGSGATAPYGTASELAVVAACLNCHAVSGANGVDPDGASALPRVGPASKRIDALHHGTKHGATNDGGQRCWDCHDPHGDGSNIRMIAGNVLADATDSHGFAGSRAAAAVTFTSSAIGGYTDATGPTYNGVCQVCHTATKYWRADGTLPHNDAQDCVSCHTHQQPPDIAFQGAGACSSCHLAPAAAGDQDVENYVYGTAPKAMIDGDDWAAYGHGASAAYAQSGNPGAGFPVTATVEGCYYCHSPDTAIPGGNGDTSTHDEINTGVDPFRLTNANWNGRGKNGVCLVCHDAASATGFDPDGANAVFTSNKLAANRVSATHYGARHSGTADGGMYCWDCHDPHGDYNHGVGTARPIAFMIHEQPTRDHSGAAGWGVPTALATAVDFNDGGNGFDASDYVDTNSTGGYNGVCQACHTSTTYWTSTGGGTSHMATGAKCVTCHAHQQGTADAFRELRACTECHGAPPTLGKHGSHDETTFAETSYANAARHASTTQYGFACNTCHAGTHWSSTSPFSVQVVFGSFDATAVGGAYAPGAAQTADTFTTATGTLTYGWTNGACNATYCHSNATPVGGAVLNNAPAWAEAAWTASNRCTKCHRMAADNTGLATSQNLSHAHFVHTAAVASGGYFLACTQCHNAVVSSGASDYPTTAGTISDKTRHVNGTHDVAFNVAFNPGTTGYNQAPAYTCTNTYCHSNGTNPASPPANTSVAWNGSTAADCSSCHGGNATAAAKIATNDHAAHVNQAAGSATPYLGTNVACGRCHAATVGVGNDRSVAAITSHVNRAAEVSLVNADGSATGAGTYGGAAAKTCASVYCHSDGTETPGSFDASLDWDAGAARTNDCKQCHGKAGGAFTSIAGEPNYTERVTTSDDVRNSHSKHVKSAADCVKCHDGTVDAAGALIAGALHLNKVGDVSAGAGKPIAGTYTQAGETCTSITCHAGKNAAWGGTLACWDCHGTAGRTKDASVAGTVDANLPSAPPVSATGASTGIGVGAHQKHVNSGTYRTNALVCTDCHPTAGTSHNGTGDAAWSTLATGNGTVTPTPTAGANAYSTTWEGTPTCTNYCHGASIGGGTYKTILPSWTATGTTCGSCHGATPPLSAVAGEDHPRNTVCSDCHGTGYVTTGLSAAAKGTHIDGTTQKPANGCTACHGVLAGVAGASVNNASLTAAPGYVGTTTGESIRGETLATAPAVGAHDRHLRGTTLRTVAAVCTDCHAVPANLDATHATGAGTGGAHATITWSTFVDTATLTPTYSGSSSATTNTAAGTCASTYCHGKFTGNATYAGTNVAPSWTGGAAAAACGTCHKVPPTSSAHPSPYPSTKNCQDCHPGYNYTPGGGLVSLDRTKHINGQLDGGGGPNCSATACHGGGVATRRNVVNDFANGTSPDLRSHHVGNGLTMGGALTDNDCYVCHAEAVVDGSSWNTGTLHMNGMIDLRDADNAGSYFQYDKDRVATAAGAVANWGSGNSVWRQEMSGQNDDVVNSTNTVACSPTGAGCKKGLDRFCISCHDADGASAVSAFWPSGASSANPFADGTVTNNYDQQTRGTGSGQVVDVASRVHDTARTSAGGARAAANRDGTFTLPGTGNSAVRTSGTPVVNDPPEGIFSRHAIRGLTRSVYGSPNTNWDGATQVVGTNGTWWNRGTVAWSSTSVMGCADCHTTDGANGTSGNAHGSSSEYLLKNNAGGVNAANADPADATTLVCTRCHVEYDNGNHVARQGSDWVYTSELVGTARTGTASTAGNIFGYACGNCHGGGPASKAGVNWGTSLSTGAGGFGTIHGTSQVFGIGAGGGSANSAYRPTYRFTNGNSMRWYQPSATWNSDGNGGMACYTLASPDAGWGSCTQHNSGAGAGIASRDDTGAMTRPLQY